MNKTLYVLFLLLMPLLSEAQDRIDLSGRWGISFRNTKTSVTLPGSMNTNDLGDPLSVHTQWTGSLYDSSFYYNPYMAKYREEGKMKFPFFLTPKKHYVGHASYSRSIDIPKSWSRRRIILHLERPHIETTVYVNGKSCGHRMSLSVPHDYDITDAVLPGKSNTLRIDVYNGIENVGVGQDSHSVTDQTQGNWNGIAGDICLKAEPLDGFKAIQAYPDIYSSKLKVTATFYQRPSHGKVLLQLFDPAGKLVAEDEQHGVKGDSITSTLVLTDLPEQYLWDEHHPARYTLRISTPNDSRMLRIGFRNVSVRGRDILVNGKPVYIRATVENCDFPLTGYPPTDTASWISIIRKCKEYGLNAMRFHSYCPPEAAFVAADSLGFYLQPEGPTWPNHGVKLGNGMIIDRYLQSETHAIADTYGNHPSFLMMAAGNEPAGHWVEWCNRWVADMKKYDPRHIYAGASVGGGWQWDDGSEFHVKAGARGLDWDRHAPHSDDDYSAQIAFPRNYRGTKPVNSPIIAHEQGQWGAFPDLKERSQYTGAYRAYNFDIFADLLRHNGMGSQAEKFLQASGRLQVLAYKYEIERNLRTPGYTGFQLLGLNDYSGQGTALVGPLNVFWREKGYTDSREWRQFCSDVVPLASLPRLVYQGGDTLNAGMQLYNASGAALENAKVTYTLAADSLSPTSLTTVTYTASFAMGKCQPMQQFTTILPHVDAPLKLKLTASVGNYSNHWDLWLYPRKDSIASCPKDIYMTDTLDAKACRVLRRGGKVLLCLNGKVTYGSDVKQTYLPVFWNTSWFKMRPPHTTGSYIDISHPLFKRYFKTDDWQTPNWWELVNRAQVMNLAEFPADYQPPFQPIDTWHVSRKLGMIAEARVEGGKLLVTTFDLCSDLTHRPVAKALRKAVFRYMQSSDFAPSIVLSPDTIRDLTTKTAPPVNMFTKESPDELKPKFK